MEFRLRIILIVSIIVFILMMISFIKKDNISVKYALVWLASAFVATIAVLIPNFLEIISGILGFELVSNMIFVIAILALFTISFSFTVIVSRQTKKIRLLIQEISLLKSKIEKLENNSKK